MPIRLPNNPTPVTGGGTVTNNTPTPANPAPAGPAPAPGGWVPNRPAPAPAPAPGGSNFTPAPVPVRPNPGPINPGPVQPQPPPPFVTVNQVAAEPAKVLYPADKGTVAERFDHAAADGQISRGELNELIRSMTATRLKDDDIAQLKTSVTKHAGQLAPADLRLLNQFVNREVPHLRNDPTSGSHGAITNWDPPTTNVDGTPLNDLAGYKMHVGTSPGSYDTVIDIKDPAATGYVVDNLTAGAHYFMVTAYDKNGNESGPSNEASKVIP